MSSSPERTLAAQAPSGPGTEAPADPNHALDALRAARLRRQLADEGSSIFVHAPRPTFVPNAPQSAWQRTFGTDHHSAVCGLRLSAEVIDGTLASVLRPAHENRAWLEISLGSACTVKAMMTPSDLRELAARMVDAAHDIEAHPASTLVATQEAA